MLRLLCSMMVLKATLLVSANAALRRLLAPSLLAQAIAVPAGSGVLGRRPARAMAVPMSAAETRPAPMAIPMDQGAPSTSTLLMAAAGLALTLAGLWRQESVVQVTRVALNGLGYQEVFFHEIDLADRPAMDPSLAWILDPRTNLKTGVGKVRRAPVQPFEYEVRPGETLQDIAARFGTDVNALLWNNGLDSADQVEAGARLTVLPVRGVLHLVKDGETLDAIAERYASRLQDLLAANALDRPDQIVPGQILVVAGGSVPMPIAVVEQPDQTLLPAPEDAIVESVAPPAPLVDRRDLDLPLPSGATAWQSEVIMSLAPGARKSQRKSGVPASVTIAQAILESDWGRSRLSTEAKNLFGIKAFGRPGTAGIYTASTWEVYGGQNATVVAGFKAYNTLEESIEDHGNWFHDNSRYWPALAVKDDPRAFARAINAAGYATDPAYAPKLIALMDRFNLYQYDIQPDE